VQLYDLNGDTGETRSQQAEHPEVVARLTRLLERQIAEGHSTPGTRQTNDTQIELVMAESQGS
jgi:hypothetical protein